MNEIMTLCTDFGTRDGYVAALKGVVLDLVPGAMLVDISHEVAPQDVRQGAWVLESVCRYFPDGTVHLAVVDPGVGTARRAVALRTARHTYVAPDNGLLTYVLRDQEVLEVVSLDRPAYWRGAEISRTFHGRDIFAPVAAHVLRGVPLSELGTALGDGAESPWGLVWLDDEPPRVEADGAIVGHVVYVDHFGNAVTDVPATMLAARENARVWVGGVDLGGIRSTYGEADAGRPLALIGSHGRLEIAVRQGSAAGALGLAVGHEVRVY